MNAPYKGTFRVSQIYKGAALRIGNNKTSSEDGNMTGQITLYAADGINANIVPSDGMVSSQTFRLPLVYGTLMAMKKSGSYYGLTSATNDTDWI